LLGILLSFAYYLIKAATPGVFSVVPDGQFRHFVRQTSSLPSCPQLGILKISGDIYFGATGYIEDAIRQYLRRHPRQRFLLLRMHGVNHCDLHCIRMLEEIMTILRERGGDLYLMRVEEPVLQFMQENGFYDRLGYNRFLPEEHAIVYLFHKILDPFICIYECQVRVFKECQNLPKSYPAEFFPNANILNIGRVSVAELRLSLKNRQAIAVVDVREAREFKKGHIAESQLVPLSEILHHVTALPKDQDIVLVCRSGWRSQQAAAFLLSQGYERLKILHGGILAWQSAGFEAVSDR
jgi:SulP family sulfate permease